MTKATYTVAEIAERWSCSTSVVFRAIASGALVAFNIGTPKRHTYRVKLADLEAYESDRTTRPEPTPQPRRLVRLPKLRPEEMTWH